MGLVFVFDIVNVKDGPTRYKHAFYYTLVLIEDGILLAFWYVESGGNHVSQRNFISISRYSSYFNQKKSRFTLHEIFYIILQKADKDPDSHTDWTHDHLIRTILMILLPTCYIFGVLCMLIYYKFFHPEGKMPNPYQDAKLC